MKIRILTLLAVLLLCGCTPFWTTMIVKHDSKVAAAADAKDLALTTQLQTNFDSQMAASSNVIKNLQDEKTQTAVVDSTKDTYIVGIYDAAFDKTLPDEAKVLAVQVLSTAAKKLTKPLTPDQSVWLVNILAGVESQKLDAQAQAVAAIEARNQVVQTANAQAANDAGQELGLTTALDSATNKVTGISGQLNQAKSDLSSALSKANSAVKNLSITKATIHAIEFWTIALIAVGAVLAGLALFIPPPADIPFIAASKAYRLVIGEGLKIIFMPIHWLYDLFVKMVAKKAAQPPVTPLVSTVTIAPAAKTS